MWFICACIRNLIRVLTLQAPVTTGFGCQPNIPESLAGDRQQTARDFFLFHLQNNIIGSHAGESDPGIYAFILLLAKAKN